METSIRWKLRDKWTELLNYYELHDPLLAEQVQSIAISYDSAMLRDLIKPGAKITGDYVLNYTGDVSTNVKQKFKRKALKIWETIDNKLTEELNQELVAYETEWQKLEQMYETQENLEVLERHLHERCSELEHVLNDPHPSAETLAKMNQALQVPYETVEQPDRINPAPKPAESTERTNPDEESEKSLHFQWNGCLTS